jgi:hypothetical protein
MRPVLRIRTPSRVGRWAGRCNEPDKRSFPEKSRRLMPRKLLSIVALLLVGLGCNRGNVKGFPSQLTGYWTTDDASYQGRFLELNPAYVIIGAGEKGSPSVQIIDRIESVPVGDGTSYTIYSTTQEGVHNQLTIEFSPRGGGEIRFQHQDAVWRHSEIGDPGPLPSSPGEQK